MSIYSWGSRRVYLEELLDREAALDRRVVATGGTGDDLELELIAERDDVRWNLELCHRGRKVDAELDALPLDEELVSDDFDGSRSADLRMRLGHRIPVDDDGLAH